MQVKCKDCKGEGQWRGRCTCLCSYCHSEYSRMRESWRRIPSNFPGEPREGFVQEACAHCGSTGAVVCSICKGTGKASGPLGFLSRCRSCGGRRSEQCPTCKGRKRVLVKCDRCNGSGRDVQCPKCHGQEVWVICDKCARVGTIDVEQAVQRLTERPNQFSCVSGGMGNAPHPFKSLDRVRLMQRLEHLGRVQRFRDASLSDANLDLNATVPQSKPPWNDFEISRVGVDEFVIQGRRSWGAGAEDWRTWDAGESDAP